MTKKEAKAQEMEEARDRLRAILRPGDTVQCLLTHVSRSGMRRSIRLLAYDRKERETTDITFWAARAMDSRIDATNGGIKISGAGMDMGFALVYSLGWALFPKGGPRSKSQRERQLGLCPKCWGRGYYPVGAPDEPCETCAGTGNNPAKRIRETDGGYLLEHRWL